MVVAMVARPFQQHMVAMVVALVDMVARPFQQDMVASALLELHAWLRR
jgi:hypothetical protein